MNPPGGQELKVGSTITLTVKQGSDSEEKTILTEKSFKLTDPKNDIKYSGGKVKLTVTINGKEETLETLDTISFPYTVKVSNPSKAETGKITLYEDGNYVTAWEVTFYE